MGTLDQSFLSSRDTPPNLHCENSHVSSWETSTDTLSTSFVRMTALSGGITFTRRSAFSNNISLAFPSVYRIYKTSTFHITNPEVSKKHSTSYPCPTPGNFQALFSSSILFKKHNQPTPPNCKTYGRRAKREIEKVSLINRNWDNLVSANTSPTPLCCIQSKAEPRGQGQEYSTTGQNADIPFRHI